jgi:hypothetical protein
LVIDAARLLPGELGPERATAWLLDWLLERSALLAAEGTGLRARLAQVMVRRLAEGAA